jgi:hypothetical protein
MTRTAGRPTASLSLDMDNLWSYLKTHGDEDWREHPTYIPKFVPIALEFLQRHQQRVTFFIVGRDADNRENWEALRHIADAGHEFGNHSFEHEPWMQEYDEERVLEELIRTHEAVEHATGVAPIGFRGPGYCYSRASLKAVHTLGYQFDASIFPSIIGPLARLYYMLGTRLSSEERDTRRGLFGRFSDGFLPLSPFEWRLDEGSVLELPVSTMPLLRLPFHLSYVLWLSKFSRSLALVYFKLALSMCRVCRVEPSFLLHPLDLLGEEDAPQLQFFPGMDLPRAHKLEIADAAIELLQRHFDLVPMSEHVRRIRERGRLEQVTPVDSTP